MDGKWDKRWHKVLPYSSIPRSLVSCELINSSMKMLKRSIVISYGLDYLLCVLAAIVAFMVERLPPYERIAFLNDPSIRFPFTERELIPGIWLPVFIDLMQAILLCHSCDNHYFDLYQRQRWEIQEGFSSCSWFISFSNKYIPGHQHFKGTCQIVFAHWRRYLSGS